MGTKDIAEKHFEEINKIFADIINGTLFGGNQTIKEDELLDLPTKSQYKADDSKLHEQERDIAKRWVKEDVIFSIIGIENQTKIDNDMVLRVIGYDGASYRSQLLDKDNPSRYPVITIVLYYGEKPWSAPNSLKQRLDIPECLDKYVSDYHINVFDIAHMSNEEIDNLFHSDFKILAKFMHDKSRVAEITEKIEYPDPLLKILSVLTDDDRFESIQGELVEGGNTMCDVLDKVENKGRLEGELKACREIAEKLYKNGVSIDIIKSSITAIPEDEVQKIFDEITKNK